MGCCRQNSYIILALTGIDGALNLYFPVNAILARNTLLAAIAGAFFIALDSFDLSLFPASYRWTSRDIPSSAKEITDFSGCPARLSRIFAKNSK
ncbi:hypothetical protein V22_01520 [Calycomorphotria hydatis]|uniref:Uncharacterized protein n=1 Tax=Calycomorphotria hydatis TaxID=2528027 RepID=A0A517T3K7_9PLAN|nr:hypothetical protein V22_01520 [Calycomorphotria hydatis]